MHGGENLTPALQTGTFIFRLSILIYQTNLLEWRWNILRLPSEHPAAIIVSSKNKKK